MAIHQCSSPKIEGRPDGFDPPVYFVATCPHRRFYGQPVVAVGRDKANAWGNLNHILREFGEAAEEVKS